MILLWMEEKTLVPVVKSLSIQGEASFVENDDGYDFGYIEFDLVVLVCIFEDSILSVFFFSLRILKKHVYSILINFPVKYWMVISSFYRWGN